MLLDQQKAKLKLESAKDPNDIQLTYNDPVNEYSVIDKGPIKNSNVIESEDKRTDSSDIQIELKRKRKIIEDGNGNSTNILNNVVVIEDNSFDKSPQNDDSHSHRNRNNRNQDNSEEHFYPDFSLSRCSSQSLEFV